MYYSGFYQSPVGELLIGTDENNVVGLWTEKQKYSDQMIPENMVEKRDHPPIQTIISWLDDYFARKNPEISRLPLTPIGGEFRQHVWKVLSEIPLGEVMTYGAIAKVVARRMGKEKMSAQAVGGAVGRNPISIIIPCHRVVGSYGSLTGYSGGLDKKIYLLEHEGVDPTRFFIPKNRTVL